MATKIFPLPLDISGKVKKPALKSLGKDSEWLLKDLSKFQITNLKKIKYVFYEENKFIVHTKEGMQKIKIKFESSGPRVGSVSYSLSKSETPHLKKGKIVDLDR